MVGSEKRAWLEANIGEPDPYRPDERKRIQKVIDERLEMGSFFSLDEPGGERGILWCWNRYLIAHVH